MGVEVIKPEVERIVELKNEVKRKIHLDIYNVDDNEDETPNFKAK